MKRKLLILTLAMNALVFLSGVGVGVVGHQAAQPVRFRSILAEELDLSPAQRRQIEQIWNNVMDHSPPPPINEIAAADAQRQKEIDALFTPQQRVEYAKIQQRFEMRLDQLDHTNQAAIAAAQEQTMQLLTPHQREKYQQFLTQQKHRVIYLRTAPRP